MLVIDTSILIAYLKKEKGWEGIEEYLLGTDGLIMHVVNVCELYYFLFRRSESVAETVLSQLPLLVTIRFDCDWEFWKAVGRLKAAASISLADAAGSTLARRLDLPFWTKDEQLLQALQQTRWCSIWTSGPS